MIIDQIIVVFVTGFFGSLFVHMIDKKSDRIINKSMN